MRRVRGSLPSHNSLLGQSGEWVYLEGEGGTDALEGLELKMNCKTKAAGFVHDQHPDTDRHLGSHSVDLAGFRRRA